MRRLSLSFIALSEMKNKLVEKLFGLVLRINTATTSGKCNTHNVWLWRREALSMGTWNKCHAICEKNSNAVPWNEEMDKLKFVRAFMPRKPVDISKRQYAMAQPCPYTGRGLTTQ